MQKNFVTVNNLAFVNFEIFFCILTENWHFKLDFKNKIARRKDVHIHTVPLTVGIYQFTFLIG